MMMDYIQEMDRAEQNARQAYEMERGAEFAYTTALAAAWKDAVGSNREQRTAWVDDQVKDLKFEYEKHKSEAKLAYHRQLNVRQALSALQSMSRTVGEEAAFSRTGPNLESEVRNF